MNQESKRPRILVVDDEPQILRFLGTSLKAHGYEVLEAATGGEGVDLAQQERPDLIILDLGLPDIDGTDVLAQVREMSSVPVIVLSAREGETDKVGALDLGADDYVTKPFGVGELMARVRTTLRRGGAGEQSEPTTYSGGGLSVDIDRRRVSLGEEEIKLTPKEFGILTMLVKQVGRVVTHHAILREVWGPTFTSETHYLRVYVGQLRQKIEKNPAQPEFILTEPGVGYRLAEEE